MTMPQAIGFMPLTSPRERHYSRLQRDVRGAALKPARTKPRQCCRSSVLSSDQGREAPPEPTAQRENGRASSSIQSNLMVRSTQGAYRKAALRRSTVRIIGSTSQGLDGLPLAEE